MANKFNSVSEAIKALGEAEALNCLNAGYTNKEYRKGYNVRRQEALDRLKKFESDPKLKEQLERILAARSK